MKLKLLEQSNQLPLSLELAKGYLRITHNQEDTVLQHLLRAAVMWVEEASEKTLTPKTWLFTHKQRKVFLPNPPVLKILEVKFKGVTLPEDKYSLWDQNGRAILEVLSADIAGVLSVKYVTGYGDDPQAIPETLRNTVLTTLAYLYENRGEQKITKQEQPHLMPWIQYHRTYHLD